MRRTIRILAVLLVCSLASSPVNAQQMAAAGSTRPAPAADDGRKLPVRRVVLYKNGVGYFEHLGRVRGNQDVTVDFTSAQLNDVLKSLTTLDLGGGRITGVSYNSDAPLQQRLGALRLPLGQEPTVAQFLGALRGAQLQVQSGASVVQGRLFSVERKTRISGGTTLEVDHISLITEGGEVRTVELSPAVTLRVIERDLSMEVKRYLDLISSTRQQDVRRMAISTIGSGERPLFVSYISEVPVWKTTYRIVLPSKAQAKPLLQGWAIVDNTVGEDWNDVQLSLVAGAPQSFIQQLSQPYYSRRPVVGLPETMQLTPQTHMATLIGGYGRVAGQVVDPSGSVIANSLVRLYNEGGELVAQTNSDARGNYSLNSVPSGNYRVEFEMPGFKKNVVQNFQVNSGGSERQDATLQLGSVSETVVVEASSNTVNTTDATLAGRSGRLGSGRGLGSGAGIGSGSRSASVAGGVAGGIVGGSISTDEARMAMSPAALAQDLGDLYEYKLKERVTIPKNQSAMVPIVHSEIAAEKVSIWNESRGTTRALRALWLTNSSALTLDGGSFSVLEDETFAGDGLMEALKPGERRLLSYAVDLGLVLDTRRQVERQRVSRLRIARGVLMQYSEERERKSYVVRNNDDSPRTVVVEHPVRPQWKLAEGQPAPEETSAGHHRFRITVEPKKTATLMVSEVRPVESRYELSNITDEQIALFLRQSSVNREAEEALRRIVAQKGEIAALDQQIETRQSETSAIYDDQERLRENIKALKGSAEEKALLQRYTRQLDEQETRLETLRAESEKLKKQREAAQQALDKVIQELTLEATF